MLNVLITGTPPYKKMKNGVEDYGVNAKGEGGAAHEEHEED